MTNDSERIANSRAIASRVLSGEMTPESDPAAFDEDVVYFAVRTLEEHDSEWLLAEARDRRHPFAGRRNLASCMGRFQREIWRELRAEDPTLHALFDE